MLVPLQMITGSQEERQDQDQEKNTEQVVDSNISTIMKNVYCAYLCARDAVFSGQGTKDISRSNFLFLAAVDQ